MRRPLLLQPDLQCWAFSRFLQPYHTMLSPAPTQENGIGLEHALYYIAFATYLELRGSYAKADAVGGGVVAKLGGLVHFSCSCNEHLCLEKWISNAEAWTLGLVMV